MLLAVAHFQPFTRGDLSKIVGKEVSRDTIAGLRNAGFLGFGPRSPTPGVALHLCHDGRTSCRPAAVA